MAWVRFDDGFFRHPKVVAAGRDARDMYTSSIFYANQNLTDGFIPEGALRIIAADACVNSHGKAVKALLREGLWLEVEGGYQIHDYLDYQPSAASITEKQTANRRRQQDWRDRNRNAKDNGGSNAQRNAVTNAPVTGTDKYKDNYKANPDGLANTPKPPPKKSTEAKSAATAKPSGADDERFVRFWDAYPNKVDRQRAYRSFRNIKWREVDFGKLMSALEQHKRSEQWTKDNGQFIPHAATWINNQRWNVTLPEPSRKSQSQSGKITSVDQLFAEGDTDERQGYPEDSHDFEPGMAAEWPGQDVDSGVEARISGAGFRAIAGGRR